MAVYVIMIKVMDDINKVIYKFGPNEQQMGKIEFDKQKKSFNILKQVNDTKISNTAYGRWVEEKIVKVMYREKGVFPDMTTVEK